MATPTLHKAGPRLSPAWVRVAMAGGGLAGCTMMAAPTVPPRPGPSVPYQAVHLADNNAGALPGRYRHLA